MKGRWERQMMHFLYERNEGKNVGGERGRNLKMSLSLLAIDKQKVVLYLPSKFFFDDLDFLTVVSFEEPLLFYRKSY